MSLEVVLVVPVLMLLALFVLWAGRGGRAALMADLAAEEAATAAAVACEDGDPAGCEGFVADVLSARPGMDFLCIGGPRRDGDARLVERQELDFAAAGDGSSQLPQARGAAVVGVRFVCETDGAVAPLQGVFPTVVFRGQATEVAIRQGAPRAGISDAEVTEGAVDSDNNPVPLVFTVTLDTPAVGDVEFEYKVAPVTDHTGEPGDYRPDAYRRVTILDGNIRAEIRVPVVDDDLHEAIETLELTLEVVDPTPDIDDDPLPAVFKDGEASATAVGTILDDDPAPGLTVSDAGFEPAPVREGGGGALVFTLTLGPVGRDVVVDYSTADVGGGGGATGGDACVVGVDYVSRSDVELRFGPNDDARTEVIAVELCDDFRGEPDERLELRLTLHEGAEMAQADGLVPCQAATEGGVDVDSCAVGLISDDEPRLAVADTCTDLAGLGNGSEVDQAGVEAADACVREDAGTLVFTVERNDGGSGTHPEVTFTYVTEPNPETYEGTHDATAGGAGSHNDCAGAALGLAGAGEPHDYVPASYTLTIAAGAANSRQRVAVEIVDDDLDEHPETFWLKLCTASDNAWVEEGDEWGRGLIVDDDDPPAVSVSDATVTEGADDVDVDGDPDPAVFIVSLDMPSGREVTVDYYSDHRSLYEGADPTEAVPADVGGLTAEPGKDYVEEPKEPSDERAKVTFEAGETGPKQARVTVVDDDVYEPDDETLAVRLVPLNARFADGSGSCAPAGPGEENTGNDCALGTIVDNDAPPFVRVSDASAGEGDPVVFIVSLVDDAGSDVDAGGDPVVSGRDITVEYSVHHRSTKDGDFAAGALLEGTVEIGAGEASAEVSLGTLDDSLDELDPEVFELRLSIPEAAEDHVRMHPTAAAGGCVSVADGDAGIDGCGVGAIADDDPPLYLRIDDAADVTEGADSDGDGALDRAVFTVSLVDADGNTTDAGGDRLVSGRDVTVAYGTHELTDPPGDGCAANEPATAGEDFAAAAGVTVTILEGASSAPIAVEVLDDDVDECRREVFQVRLDGTHSDSVGFEAILDGGIATGAVIDDDDILVRVVADGACEPGVDACAAEGDDGDAANAVAFTLGLFDADTDDAVSTGRAVTVQYCTVSGTDDHAAVRGEDFATEASCPDDAWVDFTIEAGNETAVLELATVPDDVYEHDETFLLQLRATSGSNAGVGDHAAVGAVVNDDAAPRVSVADAAAAEGDTVVFELRLLDAGGDEAQIGRAVTVNWVTAGTGTGIGHATGGPSDRDGADYVTATGTVTFNPQDADPAAQTVSVATVDERVDEDAETFELRLTLPDGEEATIDTGPDPCEREPAGAVEAPSDDCAVGTIEPDGDPAPLAVLSDAAAGEGDELVFTVTLVDPEDIAEALPSGRQVTVRAETAGPAADAISNAHGTAYSGGCGAALGHDPLFGFLEAVADFGHTEPEAVIEPGATTAQMRVATCDDPLDEAEETMHLDLAGADNADIGDPGAEGRRGAGTIADNDPTPAVVVDDAAATEGDPVEFTPRLVHPDDTAKEPADQRTAPSDRDIAVGYHTYSHETSADFTATPDGPDRDYTAVPQTPPSQTTVHAGRDQPTTGPINIATRTDSTSEGDEKFQLRLTLDSDQPATLGDPTAAGTITDGCLDPANPQHTAPPLTIEAPSTVGEQDAPGSLTIHWPIPLCEFRNIVLEVRVQHGTTDEDDFDRPGNVLATDPLWFDANQGDIERRSNMQYLVDDDIDEADETFHYQVRWTPKEQQNSAWNMGDNDWVSAEITIIDDDPAPAVVVDDASGPESTDIVFTPRLVHPDDTAKDPADQRSALSDQDITVEYHTYGDPDSPNLGATPGDDYAHVPETPVQSVTVPALATAAADPIAIAARLDDHKDEGDEKFQLRLALPDGTRAQLGRGGIAVGTITECIDPATHQEGGIVAEMVPASDDVPQALEDAGHITYEFTFEPRLCDGALAHIVYWDETISIDYQVSLGDYDPMGGDGTAFGYDFIDTVDGDRSWIIQGGDNGFEIEVPLIDDHIDEPLTEYLTLSVAWGNTMPEAYRSWETQVEGFIIDDDDLIVSVDAAAAAEGSPVSFEVSATPSERRVKVSYNTFERLEGDDRARAGHCDTDDDADYEHTEHHTLVFEPVTDPRAYNAGSRVTKTIDIETCDDDRPENNETFLLQSTLTVDDPPVTYPDADVPDPADPTNRGTLDGATRQGTITDAGLRIAVTSGPPVNEGQQANFTLTLVDVAGDRAEPDDTVTVDVATADLSADHSNYDDAATAGDDYTPVPLRTVTFHPFDPNPDARSQQTVPVATITDSVYDDGEQFLLEVSNPRGADLASDDDNDGRIEGTAVIRDCIDATLPPSTEHPPTLSGPDIEVPEDVGTASFFFTLSPSPLCESRSVTFAQHHVSTTDADVTTINKGSHGFEEGNRRQAQSHYETIIDDNQPEANETFETETHFCRLPHRDFCNLNGVQTKRWHPGFAELPSATATVTILDNDGVSVSVSSPEPVPEGDPVEFEVSLSGDTAETVTVQYATEDAPGGPGGAGVATGGADYTLLDSSDAANAAQPLVFEPGGPLTQTVPVATIEDAAAAEPDETFRLRLTGAENAVLADGDDTYGTGTITDCIDTTQPPDTVNPPQIALDAPASITEGDTATITTTVMSPAFCEYKVLGFVTSAHTSPPSPPQTPLADGADVTWGNMQGGIGIPGPTGGTNSRTYRFEDDNVSEGTEYFYFTIYFCGKYNPCTLKSASQLSFHPDWSTLPLFTATIAIEDNDPLPVVSVSDGIGPGGGVGGVEGETLVFTVSLDRPSSRTVTVDYRFLNLGATTSADYTASPGTLTFEPGEPLTQTVTVDLVVDDVADDEEGDEQFLMWLISPVNANLSNDDRSGIGTILGSGLPEVSVSDGIGPGGGVGGAEGETLVFTVSLDRASDRTVTVDYGFSDVTTTSGDYTASPGTLTFEPGDSLTRTVTVALVVDEVAEGVETFQMRLASPVNARLSNEDIGEGTIDADPPPLVSVSDGIGPDGRVGGDGGETLVFTVSLDRASDRTVSVGYEFRDVTTTSDDYTASPGTLTFEPGEPLTQTVTVALADDGDERVETFQMRLTSPVNADLGDYIGEGTIIGSGLPVVGFASGYRNYQVAAGQPVTLELELSAPSARTVVVGVATEDGTAQDGVHYQGRTRPVSFGPGRERATSTIYTLAGSVGTGEYKHFTVRLADPSNAELDTGPGASLVDSATVRVAGPHPDCVNPATDDPPAMSFEDARITEGTTGVLIAVTLTPPLCTTQPRGTLLYRTNRITSEEGDHTSHPAWKTTGEVLSGQVVALRFEFHTVHDADHDDEEFEYQVKWNPDGSASRWAGEPPAISRIVIEDVDG